jgi:hypothetical protein
MVLHRTFELWRKVATCIGQVGDFAGSVWKFRHASLVILVSKG